MPVEAVAIIAWWAIDLIDGETGDGEKWYEFGRETFVMTILQVTAKYIPDLFKEEKLRFCFQIT